MGTSPRGTMSLGSTSWICSSSQGQHASISLDEMPILRRDVIGDGPVLDDVRDVDVLTLDSDLTEHSGQQYPRYADEWLAQLVFELPGG
jgi:hypothetical protein